MSNESKLNEELCGEDFNLDKAIQDPRKIDAFRWHGKEDKLNELFSVYREQVNPLIAVYNVLENSFPVGVINELRDIFSHLTISLLEDNPQSVERQLDKALRHLKRAVVDAFKYAAMAYSKVYDDFRQSYAHVDLSYVDNGKFLPKITDLNMKAEKLMLEAKLIESDVHTDEEMYTAYELAFNKYAELYELILTKTSDVEALKMRAETDQARLHKEKQIDRRWAIGGFAVGVIGIIFSIISVVC